MLSVIMPAYNEEGCIQGSVQDVIDGVFSQVAVGELIVIDDGSKDSTGAIVRAMAEKDGRIRLIKQLNQGHGNSLINGIRLAKYDYVFLIDADRELELSQFGTAWALRQQYDAVFGYRAVRNDHWFRLLVTRILRFGLLIVFGISVKDANIPYKLLPTKLALEAVARMPALCMLPSVMIAIHLRQRKKTIGEVPVKHTPRQTGISVYSGFRLFKACCRGMMELLRFRFQPMDHAG